MRPVFRRGFLDPKCNRGTEKVWNLERCSKRPPSHSVTNQWHNQSMQIQPDSCVKITTGSHDYNVPDDLVCLKLIM